MDHIPESNGHRPLGDQRLVNPYADSLTKTKPREIVEFEMDTDPYSNMLPGISNINAARTIGRGVRSGSRGRWLTMAVSLMLILAFVLPVILTIVSQLTR